MAHRVRALAMQLYELHMSLNPSTHIEARLGPLCNNRSTGQRLADPSSSLASQV